MKSAEPPDSRHREGFATENPDPARPALRREIEALQQRLSACERELEEKNRALVAAWHDGVRRDGGIVARMWRSMASPSDHDDGILLRSRSFLRRALVWLRREHRYLFAQAGRLMLGRRSAFTQERELHRQRLLVLRSGLFDEAWFRARYPEFDSGDALRYFLMNGAERMLSPGPFFDSRLYVDSLEEKIEANPLVHYLEARGG